jgi:phosphoribosylformylglycinamidine synthase
VKATVLVRLKREVLDPQGDAVKRQLSTMGFGGVREVRIGKLIEIEIEGGGGEDLKQRLTKMADEMLANTTIEDYEVVVG